MNADLRERLLRVLGALRLFREVPTWITYAAMIEALDELIDELQRQVRDDRAAD